MCDVLIVGGGPAGLMAADYLSKLNYRITIVDQMPTMGRKFLMAGKSGLNLTKNEPFEKFLNNFPDRSPQLISALKNFTPNDVQTWATSLGINLFTGSTGRVFPTHMKASPLLRTWLSQLDKRGVTRRHKMTAISLNNMSLLFDTEKGQEQISAKAILFAMGGASWRRLGSDARWLNWLTNVENEKFSASNVGLKINWSHYIDKYFGEPVKAVSLRSGRVQSQGEIVITQSGIEGGGIYSLSQAIRKGEEVFLDLLPNWNEKQLIDALQKPIRKASWSNYLRKVLNLNNVKQALLREFSSDCFSKKQLSVDLKLLRIRHEGLDSIDKAISTAGGVRFDQLDHNLMISKRPGIFFAGEMLNWDAPTGGYLITAALATGLWSAKGIEKLLSRSTFN
ncbi:MAG: TIGR03862 family flavoprotein [Rhodobacteraceae bacterium]|nr:MAG: TIGR03862 family flavoprotein [Paracoccaceae bacterium]